MRQDEHGKPCPETLGEYRDLVCTLFGEKIGASALDFLDAKIAQQGRNEKVIAPDSQMRAVIFELVRRES